MFEPSNYSIVLFVALLAAIFGIPVLIYMECRSMINDYFDGKKRKHVKDRDISACSVEVACPVEEAKSEPTAIINNVVLQIANSSTNVVSSESVSASQNEIHNEVENINVNENIAEARTTANAESESEANPTTIIESDDASAKPVEEENETSDQTTLDWPSLFVDSKALVLFDGLVKENLLADGYKKKEGTEATQLAYMLGTIYEILNINPRWKEFELFWSVKNLRQTFNQTFSRGTIVKNQYAIKLAIQKAADCDTAIKNMDKYIKWRKENAAD